VSAEEERAIRTLFESWMLSDEEVTDDVLLPLLERLAHPDVTYREDPAWPGAGTHRGLREVVNRLREYRDVLGRPSVTIEVLRNAGDGRWAAAVRVGGESVSGAPWDHLWGYVFEMRDDRVKSFRAFFDPTKPFAELGLPAEVPGGAA
jgi:ketosteroid isomerase-like protein